MEKIYLTEKVFYEDLISLGKDVYKYPGRFFHLFKDKSFQTKLKKIDRNIYEKFKEIEKMNYIDDVFVFKVSYLFNPYMRLRYHHFLFNSYKELGDTILSYGPVIDVYLKDLLIYHLLSEYMERMGDDKKQERIYKKVKEAENIARTDPNYAYWYLGFSLSGTNKLIYDKVIYDNPQAFFKSHLNLADLFELGSRFEDDKLIYCYLDINGYSNVKNRFIATSKFETNLENNINEKLARLDVEKSNEEKDEKKSK